MDKIKNAITSLEQAVLKLESAVHEQNKQRGVANEKIIELRLAIQKTYDRLDQAIANYRKEEG